MAQTAHNQLGTYLREAREARGISLAQAAAETRIIQRYLAALEGGEYHHLPGDVYARGFIRNYSQYLNLPADELIELYRAERGASAPIKVVPAAIPPKTRTIFVPSIWAVVLIVMVLVVFGYLILNALGLTRMETAENPTATPPISTPQPLPSPTAGAIASDSTLVPITPTNSLNTPTPTQPPTPSAPVEVIVRTVGGRSWMQIFVDGQRAIEGEQADGWTQTFRGQQAVQVKAGNAAVVEVSFNGQPFTRLSDRPGQVVTRSYPND